MKTKQLWILGFWWFGILGWCGMVEGQWKETGYLRESRRNSTATFLPSGKVLVAGGHNSRSWLSSAELYDPSTGTWESTGNLATPRKEHTATLLPSGKVLLTGGSNDGYLSSAELYDPSTRTWESTGNLATPRREHTATLLPSGKVLVAGGFNGVYLSSAELYDPSTGTWESTGNLATLRYLHTATLLPSGKVLVAAGFNGGDLSSAELYDPSTGTWVSSGNLATPRGAHTASLLPSGKVLVAGGHNLSYLSSAELYDPSTGTWVSTGNLATPRGIHTATLLLSGRVLVAGGYIALSSAELYQVSAPPSSRSPMIQSTSQVLRFGDLFTVTGTRFHGDSEASSGNTGSSAVNYPLLHLRSLDGTMHYWLTPDPRLNFWDDPMTLTVSEFPQTLNPGLYLLTVIVAGVPSEDVLVEFECSLVITTGPTDQTVAIGETATFTVESQGGRWFQWQRAGIDILGATGPSYTTPPLTVADPGTTAYRVLVDSGCTSQYSETATLTLADDIGPLVQITSPVGGERWPLSSPGEPHTELLTWAMADNIRTCRVDIALLHSDDAGQTWQETPPGGGLPATFGATEPCLYPGEQTTSFEYTVPESLPSGAVGSLYKLRVRVTDLGGHVTEAVSPNPFHIVQPTPDVKTLLLTNLPRMQTKMGLTADQIQALRNELRNLAEHTRVQGEVIDLDAVTSLGALYAAWDGGPATANDVLFAEGGLHDHLLSLLETYPGVENLLLLGDDRIVPMARLEDRTSLYPESRYTDVPSASTIGQALAADQYLSDDPLAVLRPLRPDELDDEALLPDLAAGRLVETPEEIIHAIATYLGQDGILDLTTTNDRVLVTAYDFLRDSGRKVRRRWNAAFGLGDDPLTAFVDGVLLTHDWNLTNVEARRTALRDRIALHGGGILSLSGHATHYEEGVPGQDRFDIQGLPVSEIYGPDDCATPTSGALDLAGAVVYAVGCHGGLSVPGSCATDADRSLDLPQSFLGRGASAYVANSGFGWGLKKGIGLSERLVLLLTEELTRGDELVAVGDAVRRVKERYYLESPRYDAYDVKTSLQWTLYGFPMYAVKTGIASTSLSARRAAPSGDGSERFGSVTIDRTTHRTALPSHLTRLELQFDFTAPGVYAKYDADGEIVTVPGCPHLDGCYYTLNGLVERATGESDLPLEPYFIYDSRLSGTSQHGVLWLGGPYVSEGNWTPVIGEMVSNNPDEVEPSPLPRKILTSPRAPRKPRRSLDGSEVGCPTWDDEVNSIVLPSGELVLDPVSGEATHRLFQEVDLEGFYFNNPDNPDENCDRDGPEFGAGPFHELKGATLHWSVSVTDASGVWRVVAVWDDEASGRWRPVELEYDAIRGHWTGSLPSAGREQITYTLQAVDQRGNVRWQEFSAPTPESGIDLGLVDTIDVEITSGSAEIAVTLDASPDPVIAGDPLNLTVRITNHGVDPASDLAADLSLPVDAIYVIDGGPGWSCELDVGDLFCDGGTLEAGLTSQLDVLLLAPSTGGAYGLSVCVSAAEEDPDPGNDCADAGVVVIDDSMTDLAIAKSADGDDPTPGTLITYSILVSNRGPNPAYGALVEDVFPPELIDVAWACEATVGSSCTASGSGNILDTVDMASDAALLYIAAATIGPAVAGPITNVATVELPASMEDIVPGNNLSAVTTPGEILFGDGFETGDTTRWSSTRGGE